MKYLELNAVILWKEKIHFLNVHRALASNRQDQWWTILDKLAALQSVLYTIDLIHKTCKYNTSQNICANLFKLGTQ